MKQLFTMLHREWMEWQKIVYIILGVFVALLLLSTYGTYRAAGSLEKSDFILSLDGEKVKLQSSDDWGDIQWETEDAPEHPDSLDLRQHWESKPAKLFEILMGLLRGALVGINLLVVSVSLFYLADAIYKERSDGSTFYYRSLPVPDIVLLGAKFLFGYVGILVLSYALCLVAAMYTPVLIPDVIKEVMGEFSLSLSQVQWGALFWDWAMYHVVQFFWLLPFAMYFLFISASVKARPLLIGTGALILAAIVWQLIFGKIGFQNQIVVNLGIFSDILKEQWFNIPNELSANTKVDLFGSFTGYLLTMRTFISLVIGVGFGWGTYYMYQRNIEVT